MARITGKDGAVYLGANIAGLAKVADIYDWAFDAEVEVRSARIKMDLFERVSPAFGRATFTAKRRVEDPAVGAVELKDSANVGERLACRLDLVDNNSNFHQIRGHGYFQAATLNAPRDAVDDTFTFIFDSEWDNV